MTYRFVIGNRNWLRALLVAAVLMLVTFTVFAAPSPSVTIDTPDPVFIGADSIDLAVTFDNTAPTGSGNTGYGPYIDVYFPVNGADGNAGASTPDGIDYIAGSASYLGIPVTETVLSFPSSPLGANGCAANQTSVLHPYAVNTLGNPIRVCGIPGDKLVVFQLPFGSFTPDQPPARIDFSATLDPQGNQDLNDAGVDLVLRAQGGFTFGATPLADPATDPSLPAPNGNGVYNANAYPSTGTVTPILLELEKVYNGPENETSTGPNFPRSYTITVTIAPGQTITDLDVTDLFDDNIVVTGVSNIVGGGSAVSLGGTTPAYPYGPVPANGTANRLVVNYPSASNIVSFDLNFYVPRLNAAGNEIVNLDTGADSTTDNGTYAIGDWTPVDSRDAGATDNATGGVVCNGDPSGCNPLVTIQDESLTIQKGVSNITDSENTPGDTLQYTLSFQISDFMAVDNAQIIDRFSDGQRYVDGSATITYTQNGSTFAQSFSAANFQEREYFTGGTPGPAGLPDADSSGAVAGDTVLYFDISPEIQTALGLTELLGGCVPPGGTGAGNEPVCSTFNGSATTGTITYRTVIQDEFSDQFDNPPQFPGDASVDENDVLSNSVVFEADTVLNSQDLSPTANSVATDDSNAQVVIASGSIQKDIYAITSAATGTTTLNPSNTQVRPGDVITFRLRQTLISTDFEDLLISDYLPLPVLDANEITAFNDIVSDGSTTTGSGVPAAGQAIYGPTGRGGDTGTNFRDRIGVAGNAAALQNGGQTPTVTTPGGTIPAFCGGNAISSDENFLTFCVGDFDDVGKPEQRHRHPLQRHSQR